MSTADAAALATPGRPAGTLVALRSTTGATLIAATVLASAVGFLDASVVNVAVPSIGRDLHAGVTTLQWSLTSYLVTVAALLLVSGALADRYGRRRILATGLVVMLVASVLCALAPSIGALIAARLVQGVGAALVVPSSLSLLNGALRVEDRARGIGMWAGLSTLATTVGPYAGGWLVGHASWRWVFLLNVPLIAAGLLVLRHVPESGGDRSAASVDVAGGLLAAVGLAGVICALTDAPEHGWASPRVLVSAAVGVAALAVLVPAERRVRSPMLRLSLTAAVLAAVSDADLGEASAVNDAAARVGAVVAIALVPALIGAGGSSLERALADGFQPAMIALAAVCAASALVTAVFVSDERATAPRLAPPAPHHGCALPIAIQEQS